MVVVLWTRWQPGPQNDRTTTVRTTEMHYLLSVGRAADDCARRKQFADCTTSSRLDRSPSVIISATATTPFFSTHFHCACACAESAIFTHIGQFDDYWNGMRTCFLNPPYFPLSVWTRSPSVIIRPVRRPAEVTGTRARRPWRLCCRRPDYDSAPPSIYCSPGRHGEGCWRAPQGRSPPPAGAFITTWSTAISHRIAQQYLRIRCYFSFNYSYRFVAAATFKSRRK